MLTNTEHSRYAKTYSLPWNAVNWTGGIWADVFKTCAEIQFRILGKCLKAKISVML